MTDESKTNTHIFWTDKKTPPEYPYPPAALEGFKAMLAVEGYTVDFSVTKPEWRQPAHQHTTEGAWVAESSASKKEQQ